MQGIGMTDSHRRRPRDPNQLAKTIIGVASSETEDRDPSPP
jgi:hypothetical protein